MPILKPEVARLMEATGLGASQKGDIKSILEDAGLGLADTLSDLRTLRDMTSSETTKVRINETVLKMHGVMKEEGVTIPSITIIISDPSPEGAKTNDILLPRELHLSNQVANNKETVQ